ncbi:phage tail length tape measure family protein, partial [Proteus mirabilis]
GKTAYELNQLSKTLVGNWITQGDMASALTKVVGSGRFQGDQILLVARAAAQMEQSTGKSIDETINQFKRLKDDPVNAILELDKTLHLLTASEYEHIK